MAGVISYYSYDLMTNRMLSELPFTSATWSQRLNAAGAAAGSLNVVDPKVNRLEWQDATRPARSLLIVDIDGSIQWAGIIWTRKRSSAYIASFTAAEIWSYFARRLQTADFTTNPGGFFWNSDPADPAKIAAEIVGRAATSAGSPLTSLNINVNESYPNTNTITASYPISSGSTIDSIMSTLSAQGYLTGFDFAIDVSWAAGQGSYPVFALNLSYPRRGRVAGSTGMVLRALAPTYEWAEDGTKQALSITASASGAATLTSAAEDPAVLGAGYPLLEQRSTFASINSQSALNAAVSGQLAVSEWGSVTAALTAPMFGDPAIGDYVMGDDIRVVIDPDFNFPNGIDTYLRITGVDHVAPEEGVSTSKFSLTSPPGLAPVPPPPI